MLERLARFCFTRRRLVLGLWIGLFLVLGVVQGAVGSGYHTDFRLAGTESQEGFDLLSENGAAGSGFEGTIVFKADNGIEDPAVRSTMESMFEEMAAQEGIVSLVSPYSPEGASQIASQGPDAGKLAYARISFDPDLQQPDFVRIAEDTRELVPEQDGLQVELGGIVFAEFEPPAAELLGLSFAIFILLISFGSVLAMGLPIGVALAGVGTGFALLTLASHLTDMPDFTGLMAAMIGIGVGIDYALFIVTRFREGVHHGLSFEQATVTAIGTAGRAVIFAAITVVISLLGMVLIGLGFVNGLAYGAAITVAMTMFASITLLPALLGFAKARVEITRYRGLIAAVLLAFGLFFFGLKAPAVGFLAVALAALVIIVSFFVRPLRQEVPRRTQKPMRETVWFRWSRVVQRRPWPPLLVGLVVLLVLAVPVFSLRLGFADEGNYAKDTTTRKAYDLLSDGFGKGSNGPLLVVTSGADEAVNAQVTEALEGVGEAGGIAAVIPANPPGLSMWQILPTTSPQDKATEDLVQHLRDDVLDPIEDSTGVRLPLTGIVASNIDFSDYLAKRLPLFFGAVLALSFLLLMAVFRSLLVPLKAVVMNLLSIGASYGVVVAVFQWGWARQLVGIGEGGPIESWAPMMMFAIVFGLSMDYEVFLLSRIREEYDRTGNNATAVADGLASTARVITAAAAIMVFVFGSFLFEADRAIKLFGVGLATAVFLDATIVRMVLVPATMELLGNRNWWLPHWLDRILPRLNVEGSHNPDLDPEPEPVSTGSR